MFMLQKKIHRFWPLLLLAALLMLFSCENGTDANQQTGAEIAGIQKNKVEPMLLETLDLKEVKKHLQHVDELTRNRTIETLRLMKKNAGDANVDIRKPAGNSQESTVGYYCAVETGTSLEFDQTASTPYASFIDTRNWFVRNVNTGTSFYLTTTFQWVESIAWTSTLGSSVEYQGRELGISKRQSDSRSSHAFH